jgi:23S rRNA pseudouridine1911/1915/1917 synthase
MNAPRIIAETNSYIVLYKPHNMHAVPLKTGGGDTLLDWAAEKFPEILLVCGKKAIEGGVLHRLDFETEGLVLAAKQQDAYNSLLRQQDENHFIKEYEALCTEHKTSLPGFPAPPLLVQNDIEQLYNNVLLLQNDRQSIPIKSSFRAWGTGRKAVRPVLNGDRMYTTEIFFTGQRETQMRFHLRLTKGFRHQIRAHLAWIGFPILNDALYGGNCDGGSLALKASRIQFFDPEAGGLQEYTMQEFSL